MCPAKDGVLVVGNGIRLTVREKVEGLRPEFRPPATPAPGIGMAQAPDGSWAAMARGDAQPAQARTPAPQAAAAAAGTAAGAGVGSEMEAMRAEMLADQVPGLEWDKGAAGVGAAARRAAKDNRRAEDGRGGGREAGYERPAGGAEADSTRTPSPQAAAADTKKS